MHIPDNYLSPQTCAVMAAAMVPVWTVSIKKVKAEIPKVKLPMLGVGAAFSFLGMMFNIPIPGGTTGHAVGGTLIASLMGPYAACIAVTVALLIQALIFGDGVCPAFCRLCRRAADHETSKRKKCRSDRFCYRFLCRNQCRCTGRCHRIRNSADAVPRCCGKCPVLSLRTECVHSGHDAGPPDAVRYR